MADDEPKAPTLTPRPAGTRVTAQLYEQMWVVYRDGDRTINEIRDRFQVDWGTAKRAIERGWPDRGFAPLKQRAREHDQLRAEAERQAAIDKHKEATDAWYRAGKNFNRVADNAVTFCILALQQIGQLATVRDAAGQVRLKPLTKWVRKRGVEVGADGERKVRYYDEEVPLSTKEAVSLQTNVLRAAQMASEFKKLWPVTSDEQKALTGPPQGISSLSLEEMDHILETGQLPPGKTVEEVFGYDVPGFVKKGRSGAN